MINITLEGIDGAGKSTQTQKLSDRLLSEGVSVAIYNYTSKNNFWGRLIKEVYAEDSKQPLRFFTNSRYTQEFFYSLSARANLKKIKKEINSSSLLISDRSIITAYASHIDTLCQRFIEFVEIRLVPDVAIYIEIDPEEAIERIQGRDIILRDENLKELIYFKSCYMRIMGPEKPKALKKTKFLQVDGSLPEREVTEIIYNIIKQELRGGKNNGSRQN